MGSDFSATRDHDPAAGAAHIEARPERGPVRLLCDEIGFDFDPRLERQDIFVAFVRELVGEVEHMRWLAGLIAQKAPTHAPSPASGVVLGLAQTMLEQRGRTALILAAAAVHDAARELNPDDAHPTDHLIDMLASCASAIRFGLESPCRSRHAASAAGHVFHQLYGLRLQDSRTPAWERGWSRDKLMAALVSLLPPLADGALPRQDDAQTPSGNATKDGRP